MEGRSIFSLHGITGMLIATLLLLGILAFLTFLAIQTQAAQATHYYKIENIDQVQMKSQDNTRFEIRNN